eukprot:s122_g14.t1
MCVSTAQARTDLGLDIGHAVLVFEPCPFRVARGGLGRRWVPVTPRLFCMAGVALGVALGTFAFGVAGVALAGGGLGRRWGLVTPRLFCVADVALGDICLRFVWQAWHRDICLRFVWQAWHLRHWAGSGGGLGRRWVPVRPRLFCVAGVALGDICLRFVWQAWHLVHLPSFCVAGVALAALGWVWVALGPCDVAPLLRGRRGTFRFVWQAWHLVTSAFVLCGRRGTCGTGLALVAASL